MRKAPGIFGHRAMDYPIHELMLEAHAEYLKASTDFELFNKVSHKVTGARSVSKAPADETSFSPLDFLALFGAPCVFSRFGRAALIDFQP